jgi:ATP-dependent DNA helicase RecG
VHERAAVIQAENQVTPQVGTKLALSRHQVEILEKCSEPTALVDLMAIADRSDRTKFRHHLLNPLLEASLIEMTIPDKPRSSKQRYRLTDSGRHWLSQHGGSP